MPRNLLYFGLAIVVAVLSTTVCMNRVRETSKPGWVAMCCTNFTYRVVSEIWMMK